MRRVVITGLGVVAPTGVNANSAWHQAVAGNRRSRRFRDSIPNTCRFESREKLATSTPATDSETRRHAKHLASFSLPPSQPMKR